MLERVDVRKMEEEGRQELIHRLETTSATVNVSPNATGQDQAALLQAMQQQQQQVLAHLRTQPVTGRLVVNITSNIAEWENTPDDITLRAGDVITVPKRPNFVLAYGQVYNANAITYSPGKTADWYLRQAGGPTELANKKDIYIIRANGSVVSYERSRWLVHWRRAEHQDAARGCAGGSGEVRHRLYGLEDHAASGAINGVAGSGRSRRC